MPGRVWCWCLQGSKSSRSLPANGSYCGLVALSTEDMKTLGRDGFLLNIGCISLLLLAIIE